VFTRPDNESSENGGGLVTRFVNKTLTMECLGPLEADAGHQTFKVDHCGCIGGRKLSKPGDGAYNRVLVQFKNSTVSRRHFEITQSIDKTAATCVFHLRDLGSAGGTFIRLPYGQRKQLVPGTFRQISCVQISCVC
jgi:pSer/pThr/pTyr-binding forkhead associated (FHA) protein